MSTPSWWVRSLEQKDPSGPTLPRGGQVAAHILSTLHLACRSSSCRLRFTASSTTVSLCFWLAAVRAMSSASSLSAASLSGGRMKERAGEGGEGPWLGAAQRAPGDPPRG